MNRDYDDAPDVAGRFKIALAAVAAGLLVAALGTPIDWTPVAARDARAPDDAAPTMRYEHAAPVDAVDEPHVQAF